MKEAAHVYRWSRLLLKEAKQGSRQGADSGSILGGRCAGQAGGRLQQVPGAPPSVVLRWSAGLTHIAAWTILVRCRWLMADLKARYRATASHEARF